MRCLAFLTAMALSGALAHAGPICGNGGPITSGGGEGHLVGGSDHHIVMTCSSTGSGRFGDQLELSYRGYFDGAYQYLMRLSYLDTSTNCVVRRSYDVSAARILAPSLPTRLAFDDGVLSVPFWTGASGRFNSNGPSRRWQGSGTLDWRNVQVDLNCDLTPLSDYANCLTSCGGEVDNCQCDGEISLRVKPLTD